MHLRNAPQVAWNVTDERAKKAMQIRQRFLSQKKLSLAYATLPFNYPYRQ